MVKLDTRHGIAQEYTGRSTKRFWVFRYCGDFISGDHTTKESATKRALEWETKRVEQFQTWLNTDEGDAPCNSTE